MIKDYDVLVFYQLSKVNMVVDALNQKPLSIKSVAWLKVLRRLLEREV